MKKLLIYLTVSAICFTPSICTPAPQEKIRAGTGDQIGTELTIYNSNIALIQEKRRVHLDKGRGKLEWAQTPSGIIPESVQVQADPKTGFRVLEQNYDYDILTAHKILDESEGKTVRLVEWNQYQDRKEVTEAVLLSAGPPAVYSVDGEIYIDPPGFKIIPEMPENLLREPALNWIYESSSGGEEEITASYLASGFSWKADYVLTLRENGRAGALSAWATIANQSGAAFDGAQVTLIAGEVARQSHAPMLLEKTMARGMVMAETDMGGGYAAQESTFSEYHAYEVPRSVSLKKNQSKQIPLMETVLVEVTRRYIVDQGRPQLYNPWRATQNDAKIPVRAELRFTNITDNGPGFPLPAGILRVFERNQGGKTSFSGEDRISHTAANEDVDIRIGNVFDIAAERKQTDYQKRTQKMHESAWEITLRNKKNKDVVVEVVEQLGNNWKILKRSHEFEAIDAFRVKFKVPIKAKSDSRLTYKVQVGY